MIDDSNLEDMSQEELRALRAKVDRALSSFADRKRREAMAAAEEAVRAHGFSSLAEVTRQRRGSRATGTRAAQGARPAGDARYANPDDASQTWSGRGRRPQWVKNSLEAGKALEDLAI
ncbi:H-NS histone family protein [Paracoccus suum]|uniref:H-NS histone family protein n=1 Tax=Paracoccus suum TaxID=2259340 RepID=A0A344PHJ4_9RHOB|nr:H-NS histone family protein [Paracoccus suum]AXC48849.1 H-NS histone family protein [Paracoccus suum]